MDICRIQYNWLVKEGTELKGAVHTCYNIFCFPEPVRIRIGEEEILTQPNACILHKPRQKRHFVIPETTRVNWIHFHPGIEKLLEEYPIPCGTVFYPENPDVVTDAFRKLRIEWVGDNLHREAMLDAYTRVLLIALSRNVSETENSCVYPTTNRKEIQDLRSAVMASPEHKWTVEEMARQVSLSPSRFHRVYKEMFGTSPVKDAICWKVDYAKTLLLVNKTSPVSRVAEQLGYSSQYHFIRQFREVTGITPSAYRKKNL